MNELMGDNAHKGNSHRSPLPFSKCLSQPPVHGKFTNRLLPLYWKRWSSYGRLIMRIEYLSDKLWLEVTPCIVPMMPGSASHVGGIGAAPDYGEVVSKSFLLAHRPDWLLVGLCAFSCTIGWLLFILKRIVEFLRPTTKYSYLLTERDCTGLYISAGSGTGNSSYRYRRWNEHNCVQYSVWIYALGCLFRPLLLNIKTEIQQVWRVTLFEKQTLCAWYIIVVIQTTI